MAPKKVVSKKKTVPAEPKDIMAEMDARMVRMVRNSQLLSRGMMSSRMGVQFGGARDLYETFGYVRNPDFEVYMGIYKRNGLGQRVIKKFADSTWNKLPIMIDGEQRSDTLDTDSTPFLEEWVKLAKRIGLMQVMRQADIMCQIGQYSILFMGSSGRDYSQPVKKNNGLFYISAYDESQSIIQALIRDPKNEKFGMPENYTVAFNDKDIGVEMPGGNLVHHTRAIHVAEDKLGSRIYGTPRLEAPLNRLFDLEKVTGGGAEAAWLAAWGGMLFSTQEDIDLPAEESEEGKFLSEQMNKYFNRMQRYAVTKGLDVNTPAVSAISIKDIYETLKTDFAGTVGVPQRILFGSERGELASSQDQTEWNSLIETRRTNFAEPEILHPFVDWCIKYGILPPPKSKEYKTEWHPVYAMTKTEKVTYANALATGANSITGGTPEMALDVNEWRTAADLPARDPDDQDEIEQEVHDKKLEGMKEQVEMQKGLADKKEVGKSFSKNAKTFSLAGLFKFGKNGKEKEKV